MLAPERSRDVRAARRDRGGDGSEPDRVASTACCTSGRSPTRYVVLPLPARRSEGRRRARPRRRCLRVPHARTAAADAADRLIATLGHRHETRVRLRPRLSFRVWLGSFAATSALYLVHADIERRCCRPLAALRAGSAHLRATGLRSARRRRRARVALRRLAARASRITHDAPSPGCAASCTRSFAPRFVTSGRRTTPRRAAASGSPSSPATSAGCLTRGLVPAPRATTFVAFHLAEEDLDGSTIRTFVSGEHARPHSLRVHAISLIGPATVSGGAIWAILQPDRLTLLHPVGQSFWWLVLEPPLLVAVVGLLFTSLVARPLIADLEALRASTR